MTDRNPLALIHRYLFGQAGADEVEQLDRLLRESPELRRRFVAEAATDTALREVALERALESETAGRSPGGETLQPARWQMSLIAVSVAAVAVAAVIAGLIPLRQSPPTVATLVSGENAAWESTLPTTPGSKLAAGMLRLKAGIATVEFDSGAEVVLEAPAELQLVSPMRGRLLSGAAVINVPDSAVGFVMETPDGYAVDYGTQFAVIVDRKTRKTDFEVLQGEIAVHHPPSGKEVRLTGPGKTATVSDADLLVTDSDTAEPLPASADVIRIGTTGRWGSAIHNDKREKFIRPEVLSVKHTAKGNWDHRSFFEFDVSALDFDRITTARLRLNLVPSPRGFVGRLPKINRFAVYGLTNPAKANWKTECLWDESPGPEDGELLGTFEIPRSERRGVFGIQTAELLQFLKNHRNAPVTLILVRETTHLEGTGPGYTHMFASPSHPEAVGPTLEFSNVTRLD